VIRIADSQQSPVPDDLAAQIVVAIALGRYRVVPQGPTHMTQNGMRRSGPWTYADDAGIDLRDAAQDLRWHADDEASDAAFAEAFVRKATDRTTIVRTDRIPSIDPQRLPDVRIHDGIGRWIDHDAVLPGRPVRDRIDAAGRAHADLAARILCCTAATPLARRAVDIANFAIAATCERPDQIAEPVCVIAATTWNAALVRISDGGVLLEPCPVEPEADLLAAMPMAANAWFDAGDGRTTPGVVHVDSYTTWIDPEDRLDPIESLRVLARLAESRS